jgi:hypothetical protein
MEELLTVQKYAATHRQTIHSVIKKTMNGELKTITKEGNGKEVVYIIMDTLAITGVSIIPQALDTDEDIIDYKKEYEALHKKYLILKTKYDKLLG